MSMDIHARLRALMLDRGWSEYRLAKESGLSQSTLANVFGRNTVPSIATLEAICKAFRISLSQFFAEGEMVELTDELHTLFEAYRPLTPEQKDAVLRLLQSMTRP